MRSREQIAADIAAKQTELKGLIDKGEALTTSELDQAEKLQNDIEALKGDLGSVQRVDSLRQSAAATDAFLNTPSRPPFPGTGATTQPAPLGAGEVRSQGIPMSVIRSKVTSFADRPERTKEVAAYQFGMWFLATCGGNQRARKYCEEQGIELAVMRGDVPVKLVHREDINSQGGFLVPPQFESDLIDLREQFGIARQVMRVRPMASDTLQIPRRTSGLTAYFVGDTDAITESTKGWDMVQLVAKKIAALGKYSTELGEDAVIDLGNDLAGEIGYAFANKEDECGFNGDGTSTYGGIVGVRAALTNLSGTIANIAGLVVATGTGYATSYGSIVLSDFNAVKGRLPLYARTSRTCWVVHADFFNSIMEKIALAAGGITEAMIVAGISQPRFLGYPVKLAQVMPHFPAVSQVVALLGDFSLGASFGDRRQTTIAMSEHSDFANDLIAVRGTQRFDIVVHDVGNAHATAASRVAGPITGLITAAS